MGRKLPSAFASLERVRERETKLAPNLEKSSARGVEKTRASAGASVTAEIMSVHFERYTPGAERRREREG